MDHDPLGGNGKSYFRDGDELRQMGEKQHAFVDYAIKLQEPRMRNLCNVIWRQPRSIAGSQFVSCRSGAHHKMQDQGDHGKYQEQVNKPARYVEYSKAANPGN
jgi:hypothetical protein